MSTRSARQEVLAEDDAYLDALAADPAAAAPPPQRPAQRRRSERIHAANVAAVAAG